MSLRYLGSFTALQSSGSTHTTANVDCGESTAGSGTGILENGVQLTSVTVSQGKKPSGADSLTFGTPSVFSSGTTYIRGRAVSAGEGFSVKVTFGASQAVGEYHMLVAPTLDNGNADTQPQGYCVFYVQAAPS